LLFWTGIVCTEACEFCVWELNRNINFCVQPLCFTFFFFSYRPPPPLRPLVFTTFHLSVANFRLCSTANSHSAYRKISRNCILFPFLNTYTSIYIYIYIYCFYSIPSVAVSPLPTKRSAKVSPTDSDLDIIYFTSRKTQK
jgi:hypothetical protein